MALLVLGEVGTGHRFLKLGARWKQKVAGLLLHIVSGCEWMVGCVGVVWGQWGVRGVGLWGKRVAGSHGVAGGHRMAWGHWVVWRHGVVRCHWVVGVHGVAWGQGLIWSHRVSSLGQTHRVGTV